MTLSLSNFRIKFDLGYKPLPTTTPNNNVQEPITQLKRSNDDDQKEIEALALSVFISEETTSPSDKQFTASPSQTNRGHKTVSSLTLLETVNGEVTIRNY